VSARTFRSARPLGTTLVVLLAVNIAVLAALAVFRLLEMGLIQRAARGELVSPAEALASDDRVGAASIAFVVVLIVSGIVWLVWQHRSQANLHATRRPELSYTPAWAVGWWLIPFANLVMPFQTVRELWKASRGDEDWKRIPTWSVLGWWWASWIATAVISRVAAATFNGARSIDTVLTASRLFLLTAVLALVAAALAILVVRSIVRRQEALGSIGAGGPLPPRPDAPDRGDAPGP
jgi:hypothetical protein